MKKIVSYIGFAIKAKKAILGQGALKQAREEVFLILVDNSASENLKNLAQNVANKKGCPVIITKPTLAELANKTDIKIIGILDPNLAKAIIENKEKISIG